MFTEVENVVLYKLYEIHHSGISWVCPPHDCEQIPRRITYLIYYRDLPCFTISHSLFCYFFRSNPGLF